MKRTLTFILALFIISLAIAQENQDPKEIFLDAEYFMLYEEYVDALPGYLQLYEINPENANINYRIGVCYLNIPGQKSRSVVFLEFASENTSLSYREGNFNEDRAPVDAYYYLGNAYQIQNEFTKASRAYNKYLEFLDPDDTVNVNFVEKQIEACKTAGELMKKPVPHDKVLLGENVNDGNPNFNPVISGDKSALVFMSGLAFYDAIFYSKKEGEDWSPPVNLTPQVQSDGDLYTAGLSFEGNQLLLAKDDNFNSDIYTSKLQDDGTWTTAEKLNKNINTKYWESHATITPDDKTLYFTSNRKDGYGGLDIYKSEWDETLGDWGPAINLGPTINTQFNEDTPYITEDGKTLYFSSQGHKNMGGFDIFFSTLGEDNEWSKPINVGFPLNTTDDDIHFVPVNNGINALYTLYDPEGGVGEEDIYWIIIYSDKNPREVDVKGVVTLLDKPEDYDNELKISVVDKADKQAVSVLTANPEDGVFSYKTKDPGDYQLIFEGEGYQSSTKEITLPADYSLTQITVDATLIPAVEIITLRTIFFDFDDYSIKESEKQKLENLAGVMDENPDLRLEIIGHTDAKGSNAYNIRLSKNRANSTVRYLTGKGIDKDRFTITGAGEDSPVAINTKQDGSDCPRGRELNRRVEIQIIQTENKSIVTEEIEVPEELKIK